MRGVHLEQRRHLCASLRLGGRLYRVREHGVPVGFVWGTEAHWSWSIDGLNWRDLHRTRAAAVQALLTATTRRPA